MGADLAAVAAEAEAAGDHVLATRALNNTPIQHASIDARAHLERVLRTSERAGLHHVSAELHRGYLLFVSMIDGDREAFESQLEAALADLGQTPKLELMAAHWALEDHRFDDLRRSTERLSDGLVYGYDSPCRTAGLLAMAGRWDESERHYARALEIGIHRTVFQQVELHLARARVATAAGGEGRPHLRAALNRLEGWPGQRRDRLAARLRVDDRIGPQTALTPREREVAALVARGLTNGGIADRLFISTKTASVHVSNILAKLDMATRTEIGAWVGGGGLG